MSGVCTFWAGGFFTLMLIAAAKGNAWTALFDAAAMLALIGLAWLVKK